MIYKADWEVQKPAIMRKNNWKTVQSEVMISTPRRFGKTFSIAIFCACLALAFGVEIVVFRCVRDARPRLLPASPALCLHSPARRASRKLLERIVEFVNLAGGSAKICEYNQEACRINAFDGRKSLVRSFPSKVAARMHRLRRGERKRVPCRRMLAPLDAYVFPFFCFFSPNPS